MQSSWYNTPPPPQNLQFFLKKKAETIQSVLMDRAKKFLAELTTNLYL